MELLKAYRKSAPRPDSCMGLFMQAPLGGLTLRADGSIREINLAGAAMLGRERADLIGASFLDFVEGSYARRFRDHLERCQRGQDRVTTSLCLATGGTRTVEVELVSVPLLEEGLCSDSYLTAILDIGKRKQAERALGESERRFRTLLEHGFDATLLFASDGRLQYVSPSTIRLLGFPAWELAGREAYDLIHPDDRPGVRANLEEILSKPGASVLLICRFRHRDGSWRWLEGTATNLLHKPAIHGIVSNLRDVTERKLAEERLQEQAALLDQVQDAIIVRDLSDRIIFWNRSAERIYGWLAAEAAGRDVTELLSPGDSPDFVEASLNLATKGEWSGELHQVTRDGREIIVESRWKLMRDPSGQPKAVLITNTDITEKKRLEQQFLRTQRMESIGRLASGIAHDLNNVLSPILMAIHMLQQKYVDPESQCWLETLRLNAERGGQMVMQVLSFGRGGPGSRVPIQARHLVKEIVELMRITFPKSVQIKLKLHEELWCVSGDATHLHQVLMNLCVNASEAMPGGGRLTIEAKNVILDAAEPRLPGGAQPGRYVLITVADTGVGIPDSIIDKIFAPFFTTKRYGKSTGLGLSTVLGIVKKHGGFVEVASEVGVGTEFRVYLPALETGAAIEAVEPPDELPVGQNELILVADDEAAVREICKETLETAGYRVLVARDGTEAATLFANHQAEVNAVLLNKNMPILDGPAVVRMLRQVDPGVKIILTSGQVDHNFLTETERLGITHVLPKPFSAGRLLKMLAAVLQVDPMKRAEVGKEAIGFSSATG